MAEQNTTATGDTAKRKGGKWKNRTTLIKRSIYTCPHCGGEIRLWGRPRK